jgi:hypothetical protein
MFKYNFEGFTVCNTKPLKRYQLLAILKGMLNGDITFTSGASITSNPVATKKLIKAINKIN